MLLITLYLGYSCLHFLIKGRQHLGLFGVFFFPSLLSLAFQVVQILCRLDGESGGEETWVMREEGRGPGLALGLSLRI